MTVSFSFQDAHVLVTGGTSGIGLAIATAFHHAGALVSITGRRAVATDYPDDLGSFDYLQCEMTNPAHIDRLAGAFDQLDVLVNNAGQHLVGQNEWLPNTFEKALALNLMSGVRLSMNCREHLSRSALPAGGVVINITSLAATFAVPFVPGYGAAKAGLASATRHFASSWAKDGIRVNAVAPGVVETKMTAAAMDYDVLRDPLLSRTPMGRFGTAADIAPVVLFLASESAGYITGQVLTVDGGWSIHG